MRWSVAWAVLLLFLLITTTTHGNRGVYFACYDETDRGQSYIGFQTETESGNHCLQPSKTGSQYCRNDDGSKERPWCPTSERGDFEYCNVQKCDGTSIWLNDASITSSRSSEYNEHDLSPTLAIDRTLKEANKVETCFVSYQTGSKTWWMADLGREAVVTSIGLLLNSYLQRSSSRRVLEIKFEVGWLSASRSIFIPCGRVWRYHKGSGNVVYILCNSSGIRGRYVRINSSMNNDNKSSLHLCEVQINVDNNAISDCRHRDDATERVSRFDIVKNGDAQFAQCNAGYWPSHSQQLHCQGSGYWSIPDCREVAALQWNTIKATVQPHPGTFPGTSGNNSIDGIIPSDTGAGSGFLQCASTLYTTRQRRLIISLQSEYLVVSVKLYLRDNGGTKGPINRQARQHGMQVFVIQKNDTQHQCGKDYNSATDGQTPVFYCGGGIVSMSVSLQLNNGRYPLQVCEVEVSAVLECPKPPLVKNAKVSSEKTALDSEMTYKCKDGYLPSLPQTIQCLSNGSWTQSTPLCEISCGNPPNKFPHASTVIADQGKTIVGSKVEYTCEEGYQNKERHFVYCNSAGIWEGTITCKPVTCSPLPSLANGLVSGNQTAVTFSCSHGYRLVNSHKATCVGTNQWSYNGNKPLCQLLECIQPDNPLNGLVEVNSLSVNGTIVYICSEKHRMIGPPRRVCSVDRHSSTPYWKPRINSSPTVCTEKRCDLLDKPKNGYISTQANTVGTVVDYGCDPGYILTGKGRRVCTAYSSWSGVSPKCNARACGKPSTPNNGYYTRKKFQHNNTVLYSCYLGYDLKGNAESTCVGGVWSSPPPTCQIMRCSKPPEPDHGQVQYNDTTANSTAIYSCDQGYFLERGKASKCRPSLKSNSVVWDNITCTPMRCSKPPVLYQGTSRGELFQYPENITFYCKPGHKLKGNRKFYCDSNGEWKDLANRSQLFPTCEMSNCSQPSVPENGRILRTGSYSFRSSVTFSCIEGFCLNGNDTAYCNEKGRWSNKAPLCQRVQCRPLIQPVHGHVRMPNNRYVGTNASFSCEVGYRLVGEDILRCKQTDLRNCSGIWSSATPQCKPKECPTFDTKSFGNGSVSRDQYYFTTTLVFSCNQGYTLQGGNTWSCSQDGEWIDANTRKSEILPSCHPKHCGPPKDLRNGTISGTYFSFGGQVNFTCERGLCLIGAAYSQCNDKGRWSSATPACKPVWCSTLRTPVHGTVKTINLNKTKTNSLNMAVVKVAKYTCNRGFGLDIKADGETYTRICVQHPTISECEGQWKGRIPKCIAKQCYIPQRPGNGTLIGGDFTYPHNISFRCDNGYDIIGVAHLHCDHEGNWINIINSEKISAFPVCKPKSCGKLPKLRNNMSSKTGYDFPSKAEFRCSKGFCIYGTTTASCLANGSWSQEFRKCKRVWCGRLLNPLNGTVDVPRKRWVGKVANYFCDRGFVLDGPLSRTCNDTDHKSCDGLWTQSSPTCKPVPCAKIDSSAFLNGIVEGQEFYYPEVISFKCNLGNDLTGGGPAWQCSHNGSWIDKASNKTGIFPTCERIICSMPDVPLHGRVVGSSFTVNSTVTFVCENGYAVVGIRVSTCLPDGRWSHEAPQCQNIKCNVPAIPAFGRVIVSQTLVHGRAIYTCQKGYRLVGVSSRVCREISKLSTVGQWTGVPPTCATVRCPPLQGPANGKLLGYKFYFPYSVRYFCDLGFQPTLGDVERNCTASGQWTGIASVCRSECLVNNPNCSEYEDCTINEKGIPICVCKSTNDCSLADDPVCGSNGVTYTNECFLLVHACRLGKTNLRKLHNGACEFSCSICHTHADCVENSYCNCKPGYVGDGKECCPEEMIHQLTVYGAAAAFNCRDACSLEFSSISWFRQGRILNIANYQTKYIIGRVGSHLTVSNVTSQDLGEYTCEIALGDLQTYRRHGTLKVIDYTLSSANSFECSSGCGKSCARKAYVSGGQVTNPGEFPWQAMLCSHRHPQGQYCGGVLVSDRCILTAAHCLFYQNVRRRNFTVCLGRHCGNCSETDVQGSSSCFKSPPTIIHPRYDQVDLLNDIAVMKLPRPVLCNCKSVIPACLPDENRDGPYLRAQKTGIVSGWGRVNSTFSRSRCLRKGNVRLASRRICRLRHPNYPVTEGMLCATDYNGACEGDSGGPLVIKNREFGGRFVLAGIVSWGTGCGERKKLGVYTSVLSYLSWVKAACGIRGN